MSLYLQRLSANPPPWLADILLATRKLLYERRGLGTDPPTANPHAEVINNARQLYQALQAHTPHHSTNIVITNLKAWCAWVGGLGLAQSDINGYLSKIPTLQNFHYYISRGEYPFSDVLQEADVQKQVLIELCTSIDYHAVQVTEHLKALPTDISEASRLARMFAWTRKRVKMTESFLVLTGAVVATLPQFGASAPASTYTGAGMTLLGGMKVVWQHFAENPSGTAAAYETGQKATNALRNQGAQLLIAWLELYGIVKILVEQVLTGRLLTDAEKEQIRDFFVAFQNHFQPSPDDISQPLAPTDQSVPYPAASSSQHNQYMATDILMFDCHRAA
ncbi:hypothetical protein K523DRAFT_347199 [Schizophyllum commune Tattone D]|nr:hypothetical protein K525DRAFT_273232 [Schizophyllum commune Loenen D]KAI5835407.1 hypothetical protein K523DRAFT_347199 [Schizophyllum commune Tattone D]